MRTGKREKDTDKTFGKQMMELRQWTKQQNKGMTLIEVLVVVAILAITVGIAGVSIHPSTSTRQDTGRGYRTETHTVDYDRSGTYLGVSD